jgi:cellulose biosynthesis protein BcsQ
MRPFQVLAVTSNKGGVGKTTVAANLAVYLRALREELPILVLGLDDQLTLDAIFSLDDEPAKEDVASGLRAGSFASAIRLGQYGVHFVPSSLEIGQLKREIEDTHALERALVTTGFQGLVVVDTKSDFEVLTRNAVAASDLAVVVVTDSASLAQAPRVFEFLEGLGRPRESARVLLSLVDLRVKYAASESRDILSFLVSRIRRSGYPLFDGFISRSPKVAALYTNPDERMQSILHGAPGSLVGRQMTHLAQDVLAALDELGFREVAAAPAGSPVLPAPPAAAEPSLPAVRPRRRSLLSVAEILGGESGPEAVAGPDRSPLERRPRAAAEVLPMRGRLLSLDDLLDDSSPPRDVRGDGDSARD